MPYCAVCRVVVKPEEGKVICVPKDPTIKKIWEESLEYPLGKNSRICDKHFVESDWKTESVQTKKPTKRRLLVPNAVPRKLVCMEEGSHKDCSSQTDSDAINGGILLENMRMADRIRQLEAENNSLRQDLNNLQETLAKIFTKNQIQKLKNNRRVLWTSDDISYGICLHAAGPRAYNHLHKKGFPLPCVSTLRKWLRKIKIKTGTLDVVIDLMEHNVDLAEEDKLCVLSFNEMKIRANYEYDVSAEVVNEPTNYVQVAIVRGLKKSWKQPIFFDFDCRMDVATVEKIIVKLYKAGYPVVAIVCDLGPENQKLWSDLGISDTKTWFKHPSNQDLKVFVFADVPHLIKLVRNHFLDSGLKINDLILTTQTLKQVMNHTTSSDLSVIYKITEDHINVRSDGRHKVKLATQLFSNTTASAIRRCYELGYEVHNALETAEFFQLTNDWFDIFNSKLSTMNSIPSMQPYGINLELQRNILYKMSNVMSSAILPNVSKHAPFQKGIIVNNISIDSLYSYLVNKYQMQYIVSNRLNQDVLEQFFGAIRAKGGLHDHPSSLEFKYRLRKYIMGMNNVQ